MIGFAERRLAVRYARALLAVHGGPFSEAECSSLTHAIAYYRANPRILIYMQIPLFTDEQKKNALHFVRNKYDLPASIEKIDHLLFNDARIFILPAVYEALIQQSDAQAGRIPCTITSAIELSADEREAALQFVASVSGKKPLIRCAVDPSLIAGMRLQTEGWLWEDSLDARLKALANTLLT